MNCYCVIAMSLVCSSIATILFVNMSHFHTFEASLNEEQKQIYAFIKQERMYIYMFATVIGLLVGFMNRENICYGVASALVTQIMLYKVYPKSDYMLNHIESKEQSRLWIAKYNHMKNLSNYGTLFGFALILGYGLFSNKISFAK